MLNNKRYKLPLIILFSLIQAALFFLVQITHGKVNIFVSYLVVLLCCLFASLYFEKTKKYVFTQIALICTLIADLFLVVIHPIMQLPSMIFFSITQICYFLRVYFNSKSEIEKRTHLTIRATSSVIAIIITAITLKEKTDTLSIISMIYYANLIINIVFAFIQYKSSMLFAIGLLLFFGCDTIIGINVLLTQYITYQNAQAICNAIFGSLNLAWIFYVPSQTMLTLSLNQFEKRIITK